MRNLILGTVAAAVLVLTASVLVEAAPPAQLIDGVYRSGDEPLLYQAQFFLYSGRHYCWYYDGWRGPGYYWCGYRWRRGLGWGGGWGWNGWHGGGRGGFHGGRGGHGGSHFGGSHFGGSHGGGHGGGHSGGHGGGTHSGGHGGGGHGGHHH